MNQDRAVQRARSAQVVVMGVSGVGKTSVGRALARRMHLPYADGDAFHAADSIAKMARGIALEDSDRWPWLARIGQWLRTHEPSGAVVSCSSLKRAYRDVLVAAAPSLFFLHLTDSEQRIEQRMRARAGHFMPASLLGSQLATLEPLASDERGSELFIDGLRPMQLANRALTLLSVDPTRSAQQTPA